MIKNRSRWLPISLALASAQLGLLCESKVGGLPVSSSPIAVSQDGASLWVVNPDSDTVGKIDTASAALIDEIPVGDNPRTLALTEHPGLHWLFVANQDSDSLSRINTASGKTKDLELPRGSAPYGVALTPDSKLLLVTLERTHQLAFVDPRTLKVEGMIPVSRTPRGIAVTASGDRAYLSHFITFEPSNSSFITEIDIASRTVTRTI
ncbi:MAG TPA: beta-propeller fold lactonase family protein, partial [Polyangiales bacterium]|nr:beta-propeller fold lactonase family protein [Polyangiales bacterium]